MTAETVSSEIAAIRDTIVDVLRSTSTLFLATAAAEHDVWNAGAFYAERDPFILVLVLETGGTTLRNLRVNPNAAIVIAPHGPFAPFLQGAAEAAICDDTGHDGADNGAADRRETISALLAKEPAAAPLVESTPTTAVTLHVARWRVTKIGAGWLPGKELTPADLVSPSPWPASDSC